MTLKITRWFNNYAAMAFLDNVDRHSFSLTQKIYLCTLLENHILKVLVAKYKE
jgi:hypothetical protein